MKKGRYFKDELRRLIMGYATIPAVGFTLICTLRSCSMGKKAGMSPTMLSWRRNWKKFLQGMRRSLMSFRILTCFLTGIPAQPDG